MFIAKRSRVHRHQGVDLIARRVNVLTSGEVDLRKPLTPAFVPRDARISSREVGERRDIVSQQRPAAEVLVSCEPANCMPSPESPQKRTVASPSSVTGLCLPSDGVTVAMGGAVRGSRFRVERGSGGSRSRSSGEAMRLLTLNLETEKPEPQGPSLSDGMPLGGGRRQVVDRPRAKCSVSVVHESGDGDDARRATIFVENRQRR